MIHVQSLDNLSLENCWLTIGVFDGVHRGHQEIIKKLTAGAHAGGGLAVLITFWPHPAEVLGQQKIKCLTTPDERAELLGALGVDVVITYRFDAATANLSALEFMENLKKHLGVKHLLMGYDFALGKGREGNSIRLAEIGRKLNYSTEVIPSVGDESGVISSTEIRKLVAVGEVAHSARLLGHRYSLHGTVVHGNGRGRTIHFPTANIDYPPEKLIPSNGIYVCQASLGKARFGEAVNVGVRPTFQDGGANASGCGPGSQHSTSRLNLERSG